MFFFVSWTMARSLLYPRQPGCDFPRMLRVLISGSTNTTVACIVFSPSCDNVPNKRIRSRPGTLWVVIRGRGCVVAVSRGLRLPRRAYWATRVAVGLVHQQFKSVPAACLTVNISIEALIIAFNPYRNHKYFGKLDQF